MNQTTFKRIVSLLQCMNSQFPWTPTMAEQVALVVRQWEDAFAERVMVEVFRREAWRPAPARLLEIAVSLASPYPDAETVYAEVMHKAQSVGLWGRPDPENANSRLPGAPPMSHPVVSRIVAYCGGWEMICTGEAGMQEGLRKQVRAAHEAVADWWQTQVSRELAFPPEQRDPAFFPAYRPYELPTGYVPDVTRAGALPPGGATRPPSGVSMPPDVAARLRAAGFGRIGRAIEASRPVQSEEERRAELRRQAEAMERRVK